MVIKIVYWISLAVLWICIGANFWCLFRNHKLSKKWDEMNMEALENLKRTAELRDKYRHMLEQMEEASDEREIDG